MRCEEGARERLQKPTPAGSHQTAPLASTRLRNHSGSLFGTAQPRKLRVQNVDGCGGGFSCFHALPNGCGRCRAKGAAGSLVATVGSPAASTQAAQLLWRFVEQNVGELGHGVFVLPTPHLALVGKQSKSLADAGNARSRFAGRQ